MQRIAERLGFGLVIITLTYLLLRPHPPDPEIAILNDSLALLNQRIASREAADRARQRRDSVLAAQERAAQARQDASWALALSRADSTSAAVREAYNALLHRDTGRRDSSGVQLPDSSLVRTVLARVDTAVQRERRACGLTVASCESVKAALRGVIANDSAGIFSRDSTIGEQRGLLRQDSVALKRLGSPRRWGLGVTVGCAATAAGLGCPGGAVGLTKIF